MDETTNKGAGVIMITQLIMFGILKATDNEGTMGNLNDLELEDDWESRTMMFVGDLLFKYKECCPMRSPTKI